MNEKIEALQISAHKSAKEGDYKKALEILESMKLNRKVTTWDISFYFTFYRYGQKGMETTSLAHIPDINQAVIEAFAVALSQDNDALEILVCFQDIYDQIWDLSTRLQQTVHRGYIGLVKGKSITEEFYQKQTHEYIQDLEQILLLSDSFINALGNLSEYTTVNLDLIWDFFQNNDGLYCFLLAYVGDGKYEEKRKENVQIIQLKRPDYVAESIPTPIKPAEIRSASEETPKKKGILGRFFQKGSS